MEYREYIYRKCTETDMSNEEKATELAKFLAKEAIRNQE